MKKIVICLLFTVYIAFNVFASSDVKLNGKVNSQTYTLKLYYDETESNQVLVNKTHSINGTDGKPFDLTKKGQTNLFHLKMSGNQNSVTHVSLSCSTPDHPFKPTNPAAGTYKKTDLVPIKYQTKHYERETPGYHKDFEVYSFFFSWEGKEDLTAGEYSTTITIEYKMY